MRLTDAVRARFVAWLHDHPDDWILNRLLGVMIAAAVAVLAWDYVQMAGADLDQAAVTESVPMPQIVGPDSSPSLLPSLLPNIRTGDRRVPFHKPDGKLAEKMTFDLLGDGKLLENGKRAAFQVKPGDRVLFTSYAGSEVTVDGKEYMVMTEDDLLAVVD